ncbi:MAG: hypothetical protein M0029_09005 [Actinomycetota bacterium]|nr:hypothetical protein [Actinomycetota bacterium]
MRVVPPGLHVTVVLAVAVLAALAPAVPPLRPGVAGIVLVELAALALGRAALLTRTTAPDRAKVTDERQAGARRGLPSLPPVPSGAGSPADRPGSPAAGAAPDLVERQLTSLARRTGRSLAGLGCAARSAAEAGRRVTPAVEAGLGAAARAVGRRAARQRATRSGRGMATGPTRAWTATANSAPTGPEPEPPGTTGF